MRASYKISINRLLLRLANGLAMAMIVVMTAGCAVKLNEQHPSIQDIESNKPTATVYFIRPPLLKPKGFADNPISVEYKGQKLLEIAQGYYVMIKLKPGKGDIVTRSLTSFTNQLKPIKVSRKRSYNFIAGKTYFIYLKQLNEEFRGIFYDPMPVSLEKAKQLVIETAPRGQARDARIEDIESVPDTLDDPASKIEPAFPEQLYPQAPYLLEKPVKQ